MGASRETAQPGPGKTVRVRPLGRRRRTATVSASQRAREASARLGKDDCRQKGDGRHAHSTARATAIRNRIALSNLRLVVSVAKRFASPQQSVEDLVSEASILLLRCVERFDAGRGTRFSTYATRALTHHFVRLRKRERRRTMHSLSRMPPHRLPLPPRTDAGAALSSGRS